MKYTNVILILANVFYISTVYASHITKADEQEDIESPNNAAEENFDNVEISIGIKKEENAPNGDSEPTEDTPGLDNDQSDPSGRHKLANDKANCWMSLNAASLFDTMDEIDNHHANIRKEAKQHFIDNKFNEHMLEGMLMSGGAAVRDFYKAQQERQTIPAGLNLGGYCMMRMPDSILFFHRTKLRNNTRFQINFLENNMEDMLLISRLALNDLHLRGSFERTVTDNDPSILFYTPAFGEVDLLLKNVRYKMEGRYRLNQERLVIEIIISELAVDDIIMTFESGGETKTIKIDKKNIAEFLDRLKTDLDKWLKDYFNDYLIYTPLQGKRILTKLEKYDKEKAIALDEYMDKAINLIRDRLRERKARAIKVPKITIMGINGLQINLHSGVFHGLDSMYRRSVTTTKREKDIRIVDCIVGFSDLKVSYQYEAMIPTGLPPLNGVLTLTANELSAHLSLSMVKNPESVDIDIEFIDQTKPPSLTVEGSASLLISNFKHLLEHQIISIMTNALIHSIKIIKNLPKCEPFFPGQIFENNNTNHDNSTAADIANDVSGAINEEGEAPNENNVQINEEDEIINDEAKPNNEEGDPANEEAKPNNEEGDPANEEAKPNNEEGDPANEEAEPINEEFKPIDEKPDAGTINGEAETFTDNPDAINENPEVINKIPEIINEDNDGHNDNNQDNDGQNNQENVNALRHKSKGKLLARKKIRKVNKLRHKKGNHVINK